jgi:hypothetical protein
MDADKGRLNMNNSADRKAAPLSPFGMIGVLVVVAVVSVIIHVGMTFPLDYAVRGRTVRCSDLREGMSFEEIRQKMRGKPPPQETEYTGDRLQIWNGEDACTIYFDQQTNRVVKVEKSFPPLTL